MSGPKIGGRSPRHPILHLQNKDGESQNADIAQLLFGQALRQVCEESKEIRADEIRGDAGIGRSTVFGLNKGVPGGCQPASQHQSPYPPNFGPQPHGNFRPFSDKVTDSLGRIISMLGGFDQGNYGLGLKAGFSDPQIAFSDTGF